MLKAAGADFVEDNALRLSAALAYYAIFSIAPLLVIAIAVAGLIFGAEAARGEIQGQLSGMIGADAAKGVQSMVESAGEKATGGVWATIIGVAAMLFGASGVFAQLKDALNTIWEVKTKAGLGIWGFVRERLLSFGMVLVIGFLLLTSLLLSTALGAAGNWFSHLLSTPAWVWQIVNFLVSFGVITLLFALIFKVLPDVTVGWRAVWVGALFTSLLFNLGKFLLAWYLSGQSSSYGVAGAAVVLLLWVYYASCILFAGAEFTQVYAAAHGHSIAPSKIAEPATAEARAQQGMAANKVTREDSDREVWTNSQG